MAGENTGTNIKGSGLEAKAEADKAAKLAADTAAKAEADAAAAKKAKEGGEKGDKKDPDDITKTKEYQELQTKHAKEIADLSKGKTEVETSLATFKEQIDKIEAAKKVDDEKNLSDIEKMQKRQAETDEKILNLLKQDQDRQVELDKYKKENSRKEILQTSGLDPKYWEYITGNDPDEIKAKVEKFVGILGEQEKKALEKIPATSKTEQIGTGVVDAGSNDGTTPAGAGDGDNKLPQPSNEEIEALKNSSDLYLLESFLIKYPHLRDQILPS